MVAMTLLGVQAHATQNVPFVQEQNIAAPQDANNGYTNIITAAQGGDLKAVIAFVENGADTNQTDNEHNTALIRAPHNKSNRQNLRV
ncbi:MAG: hypothetical protein ACK5LE_08095 [Alphaproteobacteria bacterium]